METVTDGTNSATYSYLANSPLVDNIVFKESGVERMTTSKDYDLLNRLTNIVSSGTGVSPVSFAYQYNSANQRTVVTNADDARWVYMYDSLGQVVSGKKYWSDGTVVAGQQFTYSFDDIGNRETAGSGGDQFGANLRYQNYSVNNLNQYNQRSVPGFVNVLGEADEDAIVTVNNQATYRKGEYFRTELTVTNTSDPVWLSVTNLAVLNDGNDPDIITNVTGNVFVPETPEAFAYDDDGNLTSDGRWTYEWDGENRLKVMRSLSGSPAPERRLVFEYDWKGRRIRKTAWNDRDDGQGSELSETVFLYDGWNLLAELNANASNAKLRSYLWGLDLSGTMQGAGGVGGLLAVTSYGSPDTTQFCAYDGNGNVTALVKGSDGSVTANYEYGPFGETVRLTGAMASANPFRFSTKYQDDETDLLYYGYRYLKNGRWLSRDPITEKGGKNLYGFVNNSPTVLLDYLGLKLCVRSALEADPARWEAIFENDKDKVGTKEDFLQNYGKLKEALEKAIEQLKKCCKSHQEMKDVGICKFLNDPECHWITIVPYKDIARADDPDIQIGIPTGPNNNPNHEIYTDDGKGGYTVTLQTWEPLLTHEFEHKYDRCCKPENQRPSKEFPEGPDKLKLVNLFGNPAEKSATDAENKLRCYCTELKLPVRSSYRKPSDGNIIH